MCGIVGTEICIKYIFYQWIDSEQARTLSSHRYHVSADGTVRCCCCTPRPLTVGEKEVVGLNIALDNVPAVQELQGRQQLPDEVLGLQIAEWLHLKINVAALAVG